MHLDLDAIRQVIAEKRKALEEEERALALLEQRYGSPSLKKNEPQPNRDQEIDPSTVGFGRITIAERVYMALTNLGDSEFTVSDVLERMKKDQSYIPPGKTPKVGISSEIGKLVEAGKYVRTFTGGGNVPHRYQKASVATVEYASGAPTLPRDSP